MKPARIVKIIVQMEVRIMKLMEKLRKLYKFLEKGHAITAYTELYTYGALTKEEYLEHMRRIQNE